EPLDQHASQASPHLTHPVSTPDRGVIGVEASAAESQGEEGSRCKQQKRPCFQAAGSVRRAGGGRRGGQMARRKGSGSHVVLIPTLTYPLPAKKAHFGSVAGAPALAHRGVLGSGAVYDSRRGCGPFARSALFGKG